MIPREKQRGGSWIYLILTLLLASATALAGTTGNLTGYVTGTNSAPLQGVVVTVSGPALQGTRKATTDSKGLFSLTQLPPGEEFMVRFELSGYAPTARTGIRVSVDSTFKLPTVPMKASGGGSVIEVIEEKPVVDQGSTTIGRTLSNEFISAVPTGRTTTALLSLAPGASSDALGVTFRGATSPENSYIIDGLNTTGIIYGLATSSLPPEFIQEVQVKTGGYEPEHGRATGGTALVITKSGGNEFHGDVFAYVTTYPRDEEIVISGADNVSTGQAEEASLLSRSQSMISAQIGFDLGGYLIKDRLWFFAGYAPTLTKSQYMHEYTQLCGGYGVYGSIDGTLYCNNADGTDPTGAETDTAVPTRWDAFSEKAVEDVRTTLLHFYLGNLTYNINQDHSLRLSASGNPATVEGPLSGLNGEPSTYMGTQTGGAMDYSLTYAGKFAGGKVNLDTIIGYHTEAGSVTPFTGAYTSVSGNSGFEGAELNGYAPNARYLTYANNPTMGYDPAFAESCMVPDGNGGLTAGPCLLYGYEFGGLGSVSMYSAQRLSVKPVLSIFVNNLVGNHVFKIGGDTERNKLNNNRSFTAGALVDVLYSGSQGEYWRERFYTQNGEPVQWASHSAEGVNFYSAETYTNNTAFFAQDNWNLLPNLSLNLGIRWESQAISDVNGITRIAINDNVAPRLGLIYDFTNQGKSKLFANFGRYYESIPQDINDRALSAEGFKYYYFGCGASTSFPCYPDGDGYGNNDVSELDARFELGGELSPVANPLKGQYKDSFIGGFEYEVAQNLSLGVTGIYEYLGNVIEDISPDNGHTYLIANPGADNFNILEVPVDENGYPTTDPSANAVDANGEEILFRRCIAAFDPLTGAPVTYCFPKASRNYRALELNMLKRFSSNWQGQASYTLSQTYGNYPGLFSSTNGQLDPNITSQFDLPNLLPNREGYLDQDRRHNVKFSGAYRFTFGTQLGMTASLESGAPIYYLGAHPVYSRGEAFILPRGVVPSDELVAEKGFLARTPWLTKIDISARHTLTFANKQRLALGVQLNSLNDLIAPKQPLTYNQNYTFDYANPADGGTELDQVQCYSYITGTAVANCTENPSYQQASSYQSPFSVRLEAKYSF